MVARDYPLAATSIFVIPAQAGIQFRCIGFSRRPRASQLDSGLRRNDEL